MVILDKEHLNLPKFSSNQNAHTLILIDNHKIAIACFLEGDIGNNLVATVATCMTGTFFLMRFRLMVGISREIPPIVRLGNDVINIPIYETSRVIQWNLGIALKNNRFRRIAVLDQALKALYIVIKKLSAQYEKRGYNTRFSSILEDI